MLKQNVIDESANLPKMKFLTDSARKLIFCHIFCMRRIRVILEVCY